METIRDMIVIGGGPGGYTAALYAVRAGLSTLILEKASPGGQMTQTLQIDNYPGFAQGIEGFDLSMQMKEGAERFGAVTEMTEVLSVDLTGPIKTVVTDSGEYRARTVVISNDELNQIKQSLLRTAANKLIMYEYNFDSLHLLQLLLFDLLFGHKLVFYYICIHHHLLYLQ